MHSDVPPVGKINSSNPLINDLWSATNNSYLSNLFGYPTDCPQREKMVGLVMHILQLRLAYLTSMGLQFTKNG